MAVLSRLNITFSEFGYTEGTAITFDTKADVGGVITNYTETGKAAPTPPNEFGITPIASTVSNFIDAFKTDYNGGVLDGVFLISTIGINEVIIEMKTLESTFENVVVPVGVTFLISNVYVPIAVTPGGRINALSPFVVAAPLYDTGVLAVPTSANFKIYIWEGLDTAIPVTATYEITKLPKYVGDNALYINTNKYILDYLIQNGTTDKAVWVLINIDTETNLGTIQSSNQYLATEGYSNHFDGLNYTTTSPITMDNNIIYSDYGAGVGLFQISLCAAYVETTVNIYSGVNGDVLEDTSAYSIQNDTTNAIQIDNISSAGITRIDYVVAGVIVKTFAVKETTECKYTPIKCTFLNRSGVLQDITFFKSFKESLKVTDKTYKSSNLSMVTNGTSNYMTTDTTRHKNQRINVDAEKSITLNTGFIDEDNNVLIEQLMLSEYVWITKDGNLQPMNVDKKSLEYQTKINDKVVKYSVKMNYSFNVNDKLV